MDTKPLKPYPEPTLEIKYGCEGCKFIHADLPAGEVATVGSMGGYCWNKDSIYYGGYPHPDGWCNLYSRKE